MYEKFVLPLIPPIFFSLYEKIFPERVDASTLFEGDDKLFKRVVANAKIYGEYGCGSSTKWVLQNTSTKVIAVDTSQEWIEEVLADTGDAGNLDINHVDLGPVGWWGRPTDYRQRSNFHEYTDYIWTQERKPDVVLIDGRFRICCFLTSLKYAESGTRILFDDYVNRPHYHLVEKYVGRAEVCGRQCLFIVPEADKIDFAALNEDIVNFRHVM